MQVSDKEPSVTHYKQHPLRACAPAFPSRAILVSRLGRQRSGVRQNRKGLVQRYLPSTRPQSPSLTSVVHMYPRGGYLTSWIIASLSAVNLTRQLSPQGLTQVTHSWETGEMNGGLGGGPMQSWETVAGFSGWSEVSEYLGSEIPIRWERGRKEKDRMSKTNLTLFVIN